MIEYKKYWDHSVSPSQWVIKRKEVEVFRGTFEDGVILLRSLDNGGMISFKNDYIPAMQKLRKYCKKGFALEKQLRRDIIKLKKELKSEREKAD